jgi:hypothetical protein
MNPLKQITKIVRKPIKVDDDAFAMMMGGKELEPSEEEKEDPLAKYGVPPYEEWDPPF